MLFFDFGGTIDTNGIHWGMYLMSFYDKHGVKLTREMFKEAHIFAERAIPNLISPETSYYDTLKFKLKYQSEYLNEKYSIKIDDNLLNEITDDCYSEVENTIKNNSEILNELGKSNKMSIISNYYGNLNFIIKEFGLEDLFCDVFDSSVLGVRKPSMDIYQKVLKQTENLPHNCIMIGDSYHNDIEPAKKVGMKTIWLKKVLWSEPNEIESADLIIKSLEELIKENLIEELL